MAERTPIYRKPTNAEVIRALDDVRKWANEISKALEASPQATIGTGFVYIGSERAVDELRVALQIAETLASKGILK